MVDLLSTTAHHHHQAYIDAQGVDPEWAMWYAAFLQTSLFPFVEKIPTRSSLIHMLIQAEKDHRNEPEWHPLYAADMIPQIMGAE